MSIKTSTTLLSPQRGTSPTESKCCDVSARQEVDSTLQPDRKIIKAAMLMSVLIGISFSSMSAVKKVSLAFH